MQAQEIGLIGAANMPPELLRIVALKDNVAEQGQRLKEKPRGKVIPVILKEGESDAGRVSITDFKTAGAPS